GIIVPDLPVEEGEELSSLARGSDFKLILLVTPTTSPERAERIVKACSGFVYVGSVGGITGGRGRAAGGRAESTRARTQTSWPRACASGAPSSTYPIAPETIALDRQPPLQGSSL